MSDKFMNSNDGILETALGLRKDTELRLRVFHMYAVDGMYRGMEHEEFTSVKSISGFNTAHEFRGKSAHIVIVSHDPNLSWDVALKFATSIATGAYSYQRIDLAALGSFYVAPKRGRKGSK